MWRPGSGRSGLGAAGRGCGVLLCALGLLAGPSHGQDQPAEEPPPVAESAIERYLEERALTELLAIPGARE